jgi:hypothetical protein
MTKNISHHSEYYENSLNFPHLMIITQDISSMLKAVCCLFAGCVLHYNKNTEKYIFIEIPQKCCKNFVVPIINFSLDHFTLERVIYDAIIRSAWNKQGIEQNIRGYVGMPGKWRDFSGVFPRSWLGHYHLVIEA